MKWIIAIAVAGLLAALAWVVSDPGFDSVVAASAAGLSVALALQAWRGRRSESTPSQKQSVAAGGIGIQAGRNVAIDGDVRQGKVGE